MVTAVRSRPSHYETLGVTPGASDDEIRRAFARMMGLFGAHPVVAAASVSAAFEVLRNPDKRRAYDRALGLRPEPSSGHWKVAGVRWSSPGLTGKPWSPPAKPEAVESDAAAPPEPTADAMQAPPAEPRLASFISSSLRDLARPVAPEVASDVAPQIAPQPEELKTTSADLGPDVPMAPRMDAQMWIDAEPRALDLKRPALIGLGAVIAAGLIGAIAGASADDRDQQPPPPKRGVTVALPDAASQVEAVAAAPAPVANVAARQSERPGRAEAIVKDQRPARQQVAALSAQPAELSQLAESALPAPGLAGAENVQSEPETAVPKFVEAKLPLPNNVIARTIARIGYPCGSVVSTTSVEGAGAGVYKVACSSGQTYQATPVRGRYRFRRAGQ